MVVHVKDEVLAHHGQSDETDVSLWCSIFHFEMFALAERMHAAVFSQEGQN
jgi:hypothetical protein